MTTPPNNPPANQFAGLILNGPYNLTNAGDILEAGTPGSAGAILDGGPGSFANSATIAGAADGLELNYFAGVNYLFNSGTISGDDALLADNGSGSLTLVNQGVVTVSGFSNANLWTGRLDNEYAIDVTEATVAARVVNSGTIDGQVAIDASKATLVNSGTIDGAITFAQGGARVVNTGTIEGAITFSGSGNVFVGQRGDVMGLAGFGGGKIIGSGADSRYYSGGTYAHFDLTKDGAAVAEGDAGYTTFDYGASFTNVMSVSGSYSGFTFVDFEGNYTGTKQIILGTGNFLGVDLITLGAGYNYAIAVDGNNVNWMPMSIDASALGNGQTFRFDASENVGASFQIRLGGGNNIVTFSVGTFDSGIFQTANEFISGAANPNSILIFSTAGAVVSQDFARVTGISVVRLASGANDIQINDQMVQNAYNQTLSVKLNAGPDTIDDSQVTTTTNTIIANATLATGDDTFIFGAAHDIVTLRASNSNSANYDTISNFDFANDALRIQGFAPNAIDGSVFGSLSAASFDADLTAALAGHLHSSDALLFTATSGGLAGETFLIAATNGSDGYAAGDLVVKLTGSISGTLTTANV